MALVAALAAPAGAVDMPPAGSVFYMQTSGPTAGINIGDYYTSTTGGNGYHYYTITIPCPKTPTAVMIDLFSPELHGGAGTLDELRDGAGAASINVADAGNTIFELYGPGTVVGGSPPNNTPAPGAAGTLLTTTYAPTAAAESWVRFFTIPAAGACGTYVLRVETPGGASLSTNDDNGWRLRVSGDNDASPATSPPVGLDTGILVGQQYGTFQQSSGAVACLSFYEYETPGAITMHNFDMDGNTSVTYFPPDGSASTAGTVSGNGVWNNGGTATVRVGDTLNVTAATQGWWRTDVCVTANNQFIWEGATARPQYTSLPLDLTFAKDDGVTTAQHGGYLVYTITVTNPSLTAASNTVIRDTIPANTTFDSCSVNAPYTGTCAFAAGVITYNITGSVAPAATGTVTAAVLVNNPAAGTTVTNSATLDFTDSNNLIYPRKFATDVDQLPSLRLVKTSANPGDTGDGPQVGDTITYTVTVSNASAARQTGVVVNDPLPAGTSYVATSTVATGFERQTFRDDFNAVAYNNNDGTQNFSANWTETGEATDPTADDIRVLADLGANRLRVRGPGKSVQRPAVLTGYTKAYLSYDYRRVSLEAGETILVRASTTGLAGSYSTVATITGTGTDDAAYLSQAEIDISAFISATTFIQFTPGTVSDNGDVVFFDSIQILGIRPRVKDNIVGGANLDLASGVPSTLVTAADAFVLDPGQSMTVTFRVTVTTSGPIQNVATATSNEDPDPAQGFVRDVALTRASLAGLRVSGGTVEFATSWQRGTAGFNLYSAQSRLRRADKVRINAEFIKSPRPESMTPILYRTEAQVTGPFLWIEEVELGSDVGRMMGPFPVDDASMLRQFEDIERRMSTQPRDERRESRSLRTPEHLRGRGRALLSPRHGPARPGAAGVKIEIAQPGTIQVSWSDLVNAGLPARLSRDPGRLQLTSRGVCAPLSVNPSGVSFVARDLATDYAANNVYVISWNGLPVMEAPLLQSEPPVETGFERIQKNWIYYQAAPKDTDPWLWDVLEAGLAWPSPDWDPTQGDFELPGYAPASGNVPVKIALLGRTGHAHHLEASINGTFVGSLDFTGVRTAVLEGTVPASVLNAAANHLTFAYSSTEGEGPGYVYLNYMDLGLTLPARSGAVARISSFDARLPPLKRADYLIVTHPDFETQAARIAALKNAAGRGAVVVDVERAYDRFTAGIPDASAVKALIRAAGRASTVLLIGDDTIDPADNYGQGERVYVPSALGFDAFTGRVVSENLYADRNDDGAPDLAIGRLSVRTAAQADAMVMKIENEEALLRPNLGRHLVVVDNQGLNDMAFRAEGRTIESMLDGSTTFADISLGAAAAREDVLGALNQGALTTTYVGHGAPDHWADEGIFGSGDAATLENTNQATLLFTWACLSSDYRYFYGPAVSEAMVLAPMGGAVASFGPTGLSLPTLQRELFLRLYPKVMAGMSLGEAVREAKTEMLAAHPTEREFLHGWVLLGDPDVRLPR